MALHTSQRNAFQFPAWDKGHAEDQNGPETKRMEPREVRSAHLIYRFCKAFLIRPSTSSSGCS